MKLIIKMMKTDNENFHIIEADDNKRRFMPLLLIGDEAECMIERYLDRCNLYVGFINKKAIAVCAATVVDDDTVEVKNLAVAPDFRRQGYGRRMLEHIELQYSGKTIVLGTGETPSTLRFYRSCGFSYSHRIPNFFTDNYPEPIVEEGTTLRDMLYLKKDSTTSPTTSDEGDTLMKGK